MTDTAAENGSIDRTTRGRRQPLLVAAAACLAALAGSSGAQAAPALEKLTLSFSEKTVDFLPLRVAVDAGYFKKHGIDATVRYLPAQEGIPAVLAGQVQGLGIGGADALSAEAQGAKLKLVTTFTPIYIFQFWARPQYAKPGALKGQRVGVPSTTGSLYAATVLILKQLGLTTSDVAITSLGSVVNVNSSLLAGSVAAAASHPPATYQFKHGGLVDLVDLAKKKIPSVSSGVWFTQSYLNAHRALVQNVVDALADALHRERTDRAFTEKEITKYMGIKNKAQLDFTYNFYVNDVLPQGPLPTVAELASDKKSLSASNPKVKKVNVSEMIDPSFVKKTKQ